MPKKRFGNGGRSAPYSHSRCIGDLGGQPGWPLAGPATDNISRPVQLSPGQTGGGEGGGAYSFVACLGHLTIDHASLSRRSTVPTPNRDTSNIWALVALLPYIT